MTETVTREAPHYGVKVGDYFYRSWGYDQTNVNFYKVVALTAKCVKIVEVRSACVEDNGPQVYLVPTETPLVADTLATYCECTAETFNGVRERVKVRKVDAEFATVLTGEKQDSACWVCYRCNSAVAVDEPQPEVMVKRLRSYGPGNVSAAFNSYSGLHLWDGSPKYQTGTGWGH